MTPSVRLLLTSLAGSCAAACSQAAEASPPQAFETSDNDIAIQRAGPVAFDVAVAELGLAPALPPVPGRVTTVESLTSPTFAPLAGRVVETRVRLGEQVTRGQKLALVRAAELPALQHELRAAELAVATRQGHVARLRALVEARAGVQSELSLAESELAQARLLAKTAKAKLASLRVSQAADNAYWVLAERGGTVVQLDAAPGQQVGPDPNAPMVTVTDLSEVFVVADVPQADAAELQPGGMARISLSAGVKDEIVGHIEVVSELVDPARQTVPVRVRVDNQARKLRPNAFVELAFERTRAESSVLVPASAVVRDGASSVVFVEVQPGVYARRSVQLGRAGRDQVEILSGLAAGERVVKTSALLLLNALGIEV